MTTREAKLRGEVVVVRGDHQRVTCRRSSRPVSLVIDEITEYLRAWEQGDDGALERLLPFVYAELRAIAGRHLGAERPGHTLQPTALVNEAYLRLRGLGGVPWHDRTHFFAIASRIMRRLLVDHARGKMAQKRGADAPRVVVSDGEHGGIQPSLDAAELIDLDRALDELAAGAPRLARLVELRFFSGLGIEEASSVLGCSTRTAKRDWAFARAWLLNRLSAGPGRSQDHD
jgi:RNA polymerase sigma factor (TIGR02999 family)